MSERGVESVHHRFVRAVAVGLKRRCGVRTGSRVLVAVSGGPDSVALLRAMAILAPRRRWQLDLAVGHVQHHLRDEPAESDARFVEDLAAQLDLPYLRADLDWLDQTGNTEARARQMRYAALATMADTYNAPYIATGHHGDDQLETLLMRLLRGAGVTGMRGIAWRRGLAPANASPRTALLIRPMLGTTRREAVDFLDQLSQPWREDHTNQDRTRLRARLRQEVLPVLRAVQTDAARKAVALANHARELHALLETEINRHHEHVIHDQGLHELDRGEARLMPRIVLAGLIRRLLRNAGVPADRLGTRTLDPIVHAIRDRDGNRRTYKLAGRVTLTITRETVTVR